MSDVGVFSPLVLLMMMLTVNYQQRMDDVGKDETSVSTQRGGGGRGGSQTRALGAWIDSVSDPYIILVSKQCRSNFPHELCGACMKYLSSLSVYHSEKQAWGHRLKVELC